MRPRIRIALAAVATASLLVLGLLATSSTIAASVGVGGGSANGEPKTVSIQPTPDARAVLEALLENAVRACNADVRNNPRGHAGCLLLRDVVIDGDKFHYDAARNPAAPQVVAPFPVIGATRHHMAPITLQPYKSSALFAAAPATRDAAVGAEVVYYQSPVLGAMWVNMWHTLADYFLMVFHTVGDLVVNHGVPLHFMTRTGKAALRKGCATPEACEAMALFSPFATLFSRGKFSFLHEGRKKSRHAFVLIGINTRCSPIATEELAVPECHAALRGMRDFLLSRNALDPLAAVSSERRRCPTVHFMSRQGDKYRHMTPFEDSVAAVRRELQRRGCPSTENDVRVIKLHGGMSFAEQVRSVNNHTVLIAGRGGGTALMPFLPIGGGFLSVSGFDKWNPFRDLEPAWLAIHHYEAQLVHHENPQSPPQKFCSKGKCYVDPNRAAYRIDPTALAAALCALIDKMNSRT